MYKLLRPPYLPAKIRNRNMLFLSSYEIPRSSFLRDFNYVFSSMPLPNNHLFEYNNPFQFSQPGSFYAHLIDNSTHKKHLNQIHTQLVVSGCQHNGFLMAKLVNRSSNIGDIGYARKVFDEFYSPHVFIWNAIIRCYSNHYIFGDAIHMYRQMQCAGVNPDCYTFSHVLKACGGLQDIWVSTMVHGQIIRNGLESDVILQNGLVALYSKLGYLKLARMVFDRLGDRTIISWTSIISGYAQNGEPIESLRIFTQMKQNKVKPDWIALVSVIKAYADIEDLGQGQSIHGCVIKMGLEYEPDLLISLTALYSKCGQVTVARSFFDMMETPNLVLWNAMISGYAKSGHSDKAVELFLKLISEDIRPDAATVSSTIRAFSQLDSIELARWIDDYTNNSEYRNNVVVNTALIDMYAKCGSVELARAVFDRMLDKDKDVFVWSAMISGYGLHGKAREAIDLYHAMRQAGLSPNDITFLGLLTACNHSGLVEEGWHLFNCMRAYKIEPCQQHYSCVVDLLGRAGYLDRAFDFITKMSIEPGISVWGALLSACKIHHNVTLGQYAAEKLFSLDPYNIGHYVQLSNLYASVGLWDDVANVRVLMMEAGLIKDIGCTLIGSNGKFLGSQRQILSKTKRNIDRAQEM